MRTSTVRRPRAPRITETLEHLVIADYFRKIGLGGNAVAFHIRNEQATASQRGKAVRMGIMPGIGDWCVIHNGRAIFAEVKPRGWRATRERTGDYTAHEHRQLDTHETLKRAGASVFVVETLEELLTELLARGVPIKSETLPARPVGRGLNIAMAEAGHE